MKYPFAGARAPAAVALLMLAGACAPKSNDTATADTAQGVPRTTDGSRSAHSDSGRSAMTGTRSDTASINEMGNMPMTGDADHDFLRMMSDHHKGLIAMAHETMEDKGTPAVRVDAKKLDTKQDEELERMVMMLDREYKDPYEPKVMPSHQKMLDSLLTLPGSRYATTFYRNVVTHHRQAIVMIDAYLPKAHRAELKAMAEKMKQDQTREIAEFERKAGAH